MVRRVAGEVTRLDWEVVHNCSRFKKVEEIPIYLDNNKIRRGVECELYGATTSLAPRFRCWRRYVKGTANRLWERQHEYFVLE